MPLTYFITNDTAAGRENKASSTYCYTPGEINRARYKGAATQIKAHAWWLYCTAHANRAEFLAAIRIGTKFSVTAGDLGGAITITEVSGQNRTYDLILPVLALRTVELIPYPNNEFRIGHYGHWVCADNDYRQANGGLDLVAAKVALAASIATL